jgi:hypothetical protein
VKVDVIVKTGGDRDHPTTTVVASAELTDILQVEDSRVPLETNIIGVVVMTTVPVDRLLQIDMVAVITTGTMAVGAVHHREAVRSGMARLELLMSPHYLCHEERQNKFQTYSSLLLIKLIGT